MSTSFEDRPRAKSLKAANALSQAAADKAGRPSLGQSLAVLATILFQLAVVAAVLRIFQIDSTAFRYQYAFLCLVFVAHHLVHLWLPASYGLACFAIGSLGAIFIMLGPLHSVCLVGIGLALLGIAHLPIAFWARVAVMAVVAAGLGVLRGMVSIPLLNTVWPILASMFMFRMMVYLHDMRTGSAPTGLWRSLAYFFMAPNACFPLFPIVDYKTFTRVYYNQEALGIYQKGVDWIIRGVVQLLLYRLVYQNFLIDPSEITGAGSLARYLLTNFLLYLRVSGNFHLIVGLLHLFGFNLSETHHRYLLADSFTDFWRRINIYWKDFIQKLFFFPVYFRIKKHGETMAVAISTCVAFFVTWALHSYQWFWLRGSFLLTWQDITFWTVLALGVLVNVLYEVRNSRARASLKLRRTWQGDLKALHTIAMFSFMCLLWSLWNASSLEEWTTMLSMARYVSALDLLAITLGLAVVGVSAVLFGYSTSERSDAPVPGGGAFKPRIFWLSAGQSTALAAVVLLVGLYPAWFSPTPAVARVLGGLRTHRLNAQDVAKLERGYYEDLIDESRFNAELSELYATRPHDWNWQVLEHQFPGREFPNWGLRPNSHSHTYGPSLTVNRWGMRDRDYELQKPAGVFRLAVLGDSNSAGYGVTDTQVFEHLVEERLNAQSPGTKYELLNFSVGSYGPYSRLQVLRCKVLEFQPDAVLFVAVNDVDWILRDISRCLKRKLDVPDGFVSAVIDKAGASPGMGNMVSEQRLKPYAEELIEGTYREFARHCREAGIRAYAVFLPRLDDRHWEQDQLPLLLAASRCAGFTVLDASNAYSRVDDWRELWVQPWDAHSNARGHQLVAESIHAQLLPHIVPPPAPLPRSP